jgi:hypothetical protein
VVRSLPTGTSTRAVAVLGGLLVSSATLAPKAPSTPLQAHIEHTVRLPSVSPTLRPGATFNLSAEHTPNNLWIRIPRWLAGRWSVSLETTVFHEDYLSGRITTPQIEFHAKSRFSYGHQRDSRGDVWHYLGTPYTSTTDVDDYTEFHQVASKNLVESNANTASLKTRVTVVRANKSTLLVVKTFQQESITKYTYISPGELFLQSSTKVFDASGEPTDEVQNEARVHRVAPFIPIESGDGRNYRELFRQFLTAEGLPQLIPDD